MHPLRTTVSNELLFIGSLAHDPSQVPVLDTEIRGVVDRRYLIKPPF